MKKTVIAFVVLFSATAANGHTPAESNEVVSAALTRAAFYYDDLPEGSPPDNDPPPSTWLGFLGPETNGWTLAGKMAAFDRYLSTLVTNDCKSGREMRRIQLHELRQRHEGFGPQSKGH